MGVVVGGRACVQVGCGMIGATRWYKWRLEVDGNRRFPRRARDERQKDGSDGSARWSR